jgi:hypothetical protein
VGGRGPRARRLPDPGWLTALLGERVAMKARFIAASGLATAAAAGRNVNQVA